MEKSEQNKIMVFDQGAYLGLLDTEDYEKNDHITTLITVILPDNSTSTVLHIKDMEYGIVISDTIANKIYAILEGNKNGR